MRRSLLVMSLPALALVATASCSGADSSLSTEEEGGNSSGVSDASGGTGSGGRGSSSGSTGVSGGTSDGGGGSSSRSGVEDASDDSIQRGANDSGAPVVDATTHGDGAGPPPVDAATGPQDARVESSAPMDASEDATHPRDAASDAHETGTDASAPDGSIVSCSGATASLKNDVYPILMGCGGELCHGGLASGPWGGPAGAHDQLVNAPEVRDGCDAGVLVSPGSIQNSYLINKLTGVGMCPGSMQMPRLGLPLPEKEIQTIADWICAGAPND
jgi:hypothetical protein